MQSTVSTPVAPPGNGVAQPKSIVNGASLLKISTTGWFAITVAGQWIFATYVALFYGSRAFSANWEGFNDVAPHGYEAGDLIGNIAFGMHMALALIILFGGPLQLMPQVRNTFPKFHRGLGRIYIPTTFLMAVGGIFMVWNRGTVGGVIGHIAVSINAVIIMVSAVLAVRYAIKRKITIHRRWAIRLFLACSGVWFFRVGLMAWIFAWGGPVGFDPKSFTGPFLSVLGIMVYVAPQVFAQLYFMAQDNRQQAAKIGAATMMGALMLVTIWGVFAATLGMWLPRLQ